MATNRNELKEYFLNGKIPNQEQFAALIDETLIKTDDKLTITPVMNNGQISHTRVGVNDTAPDSPLSVKAQSGGTALTIKSAVTDTNHWRLIVNQTGPGITATGLTIARDETNGTVPRLHIDERGFVGIGTQTPQSILSVNKSELNGSVTVRIRNAAGSHNGWTLNHTHSNDATLTDRFSISEIGSAGNTAEHFTISSGGKVGIGTGTPEVKLTVAAASTTTNVPLSLEQGTGVLMLGNTSQNLSFDNKAIQVRINDAGSVAAGKLDLQPLGGAIEIHTGATSDEEKIKIESNGRVALGTGTTPNSRLEVKGSVRLVADDAEADISLPGTFRFRNNAFEGHNGTEWLVFNTSGAAQNFWQSSGQDSIRYNNFVSGRTGSVIIGEGTTSQGTLVVQSAGTNATQTTFSAVAVTQGQYHPDGKVGVTRNGLKIEFSGNPSTSIVSRDIGLMINTNPGLVSSSGNSFAAILNGNVAVGTHSPETALVGQNGRHVLSVAQTSSAPTSAVTTAVQLYTTNVGAVGSQLALHLMNPGSSATPVKLYNVGSISPQITPAPSFGTAELNTYIDNLKARIEQLESCLVSLGFLTSTAG
ncbi:MAG: hypothetical protein ACK5Z2_12300 [Bacteroidota bacterium]